MPAKIPAKYAALAEPVDAELNAARLSFRKNLAVEFAERIAAAVTDKHLPEQDASLAAAALVGLLVEGLIGPLAPETAGRERDILQSLALVVLRALGVTDARARGLVVQTPLPADDDAA
jgi:AcrR family transcriptional regulator